MENRADALADAVEMRLIADVIIRKAIGERGDLMEVVNAASIDMADKSETAADVPSQLHNLTSLPAVREWLETHQAYFISMEDRPAYDPEHSVVWNGGFLVVADHQHRRKQPQITGITDKGHSWSFTPD